MSRQTLKATCQTVWPIKRHKVCATPQKAERTWPPGNYRGFLHVWVFTLTQDWNQKTSRCLLGQAREIACGCLAFSRCCGSILSSSPCGSPAPLPGRRCSCPWTVWELLTWFLKHPKSPELVTPVETHLCLGAAPVAAGWGWSLAHGSFLSLQIWSEKCFSFPDHTTHFLICFLLTFLYLTEFIRLVCPLFTSQFPVVYTTSLSYPTTQCLASSWD